MSENMKEERQKERDHALHQAALSGASKNGAHETLKYVSEPEEEFDSPSEALRWINSKSASTTKLTEDDVRSKEWVMEYMQLLGRMQKPPHYGVHGHARGYARADYDAAVEPLEPGDTLDFEGFTELGKLTTKKSEEGWGVETSTRDIKESYVRKDESDGGGGWFGRFRD